MQMFIAILVLGFICMDLSQSLVIRRLACGEIPIRDLNFMKVVETIQELYNDNEISQSNNVCHNNLILKTSLLFKERARLSLNIAKTAMKLVDKRTVVAACDLLSKEITPNNNLVCNDFEFIKYRVIQITKTIKDSLPPGQCWTDHDRCLDLCCIKKTVTTDHRKQLLDSITPSSWNCSCDHCDETT